MTDSSLNTDGALRVAHTSWGPAEREMSSGAQQIVYQLARAQAELGMATAVFALTLQQPNSPIPGVSVYSHQRNNFGLGVPAAFMRDLFAWKPDVVHMHSVFLPSNILIARACRRHDVRYVVTPHGGLSPPAFRARRQLKYAWMRLLELPMLNRAAFVHATADTEQIRTAGVRAPIVDVPNGIDLPIDPADADPGYLVRRFPQLLGKRVWLYIGRLAPNQKGLDWMLRAFASVRPKDTALVLVGPDWRNGQAELEALRAELDLVDDVLFAGPAYGREKVDAAAGANAVLQTSRWEGMSLSLLEIAAVGRPILATVPADPYGRFAGNGAAIVVKPKLDAIVAGLHRLADMTADDLAALGERARQLVVREFTWRRAADELRVAYARSLQGAATMPVAAEALSP